MKCQYKDQKRHMFRPHIFRQVSMLHLTVLPDSVEHENSAQTMSTRRITFTRPPNPLDRAEPPKRTRPGHDEHSALPSVSHRGLVTCLKI